MFDEQNNKIESDQFKCPSCGNNMEFAPGTTRLKCPYCGREEEIDNLSRVSEQDLDNSVLSETVNGDVEVFACENCGAITEVPKGAIAFSCPYCKKTNVLKLEDIKGVKPTGVIPFKISKDNAIKSAREYVKHKLFVALSIKKADFNTFLSGVYSPIWTFDMPTHSVYSGRVGDYHTVTVRTKNGTVTKREIRWRHVSGQIDKYFNDVKISAREIVEDKNVYKVTNFETDNAAKYDKRFLAGFYALHYSKPIKEAYSEAKRTIRPALLSEIKRIHHADVVDESMSIDTRIINPTYKYILAPYYLGEFSHHDKKYQMVINGFNGKTWAKYPVSPVKVSIAVILGLVALAAILFLVAIDQGLISM